MTTTITIDDITVYEQRPTAQITHICATRRVAQILAAELELRNAGWSICGLGSSDRPRRPLLLPGDAMGRPLDGRRSDERAQGFTARRGRARLTVDASADLPACVLAELGDTVDARCMCEWYLGPLS